MEQKKKNESIRFSFSNETDLSPRKKAFFTDFKKDLPTEETTDHFIARFASESLLKHSSQLLSQKMSYQSVNYSLWSNNDTKLVGLIASRDFTKKFEKNPANFEIKKMSLICENNSVKMKINKEDNWVSINNLEPKYVLTDNLDFGLKLEDQIIKMNKPLNLRCLGFRASLNFILKDLGSSISLLLRSNENISNEETILIQFMKEGNEINQRLFVAIGKLNENGKEFVYLKKCEIPIFNQKEEYIKKNLIEVNTHVIDYGSDKLKMVIEVVENSGKPFKLKYSDMFIPYFEDFYFYIIGNGNKTFVKKIICEFLDRKAWETDSGDGGQHIFGKCHCKLF